MQHAQPFAEKRRKLDVLEHGRIDPPIAGLARSIRIGALRARMRQASSSLTLGRIARKSTSLPSRAIEPFEIAKQPRRGKDLAHEQGRAPAGMAIDDVGLEAFRAAVRLRRERLPGPAGSPIPACGYSDAPPGAAAGRREQHAAHAGDLALPRLRAEDNLIAGDGRQRTGQMPELSRKIVMKKQDTHCPLPSPPPHRRAGSPPFSRAGSALAIGQARL